MSEWSGTVLGDEIELAYGKSLAAHSREPGPFEVFGSNGCVGRHSQPLIKGPGIIVGRKGSVGEIAYSVRDFWPIDTTYYVVNKREHDWRFLYHLLSSLGLESLNSHSAVPGLNREDAYSIAVKLPPKFEQTRIALALDALQNRVDLEAEAIRQTRSFRRATMRVLFSKGLHGEPQKETELGLVPETWTITTLAGLCDEGHGCIQTGPFGSQLHAHEYKAEGTPVINPTHLAGNRIEHSDVPRVDASTALRLARHSVRSGDILFGRRGEIGRHGLVSNVESGWLCGTGCFLVRMHHPNVDNAFLSYLFSMESSVAWLVGHAAGTIMPNLNNAVLSRLPVVYPALSEQRDIVDLLDGIERKLDLHVRRQRVLDRLFKALLQNLITGQLRAADIDLSALESKQAEVAA